MYKFEKKDQFSLYKAADIGETLPIQIQHQNAVIRAWDQF